MIRFYEYKTCSTCVKAAKFLAGTGTKFERLPIVEVPPSLSELRRMLGYVGLKKLFNTSGVLYREMGIAKKLDSMSEADALTLLSKNGKLIKRPFVLGPDFGLVGFKESDWAERFG